VKIYVKPWRFDMARDAVLTMIPPDIDVCASLDLDEVLMPGWRQEIERVWKVGETTRLRYMFNWGGPVAFKYEKIHARFGYRWRHPVHEYPMPYGIEEVWADTDFLMVVHKPDPTKSRAQYMPMLEMSVKEDPDCPRNAFYHARELSFHGRYKESIEACERYLKLPRATWSNERQYAYRTIGRCWIELGQFDKAETAFRMAAIETPNSREPWFELAKLMQKQDRFAEGYAAAWRCLAITNKELVYTVDHDVWTGAPHNILAVCAYYLGLKDEARKHGAIALNLSPENDLYRTNMEFYAAG
jgi:hypothetical protein